MTLTTHRGGCHCGRIRFEVNAPADIEAYECNCSMCDRVGFLHLIVPKSQFLLLSGQDDLVSYRFNTGTANHLFCRTCGVKSFYVPRSHPDGFSVNVRCLDRATIRDLRTMPFDGANWEKSIGESHMEKDDRLRSKLGVVVTLTDIGNGRSRLYFDDVRSETNERNKHWFYYAPYTVSPDFSNDDLDAMRLGPEDFRRIGEVVIARLLAIEGRGS